MGLKGAPAYFQRVMSINLLGDLLSYGVENHLDDCVVYGSTEEEFLSNLKKVMERFEKHNKTFNQKKWRFFGMSSIEYVGRAIDQHRIHFDTRQSLEEVLKFAILVRIKDLERFIEINWLGLRCCIWSPK